MIKAHKFDIFGYVMNIAAKITSLTDPNKVSVGENVYKLLDPGIQAEFHELAYGTDEGNTLILTRASFTKPTHSTKI
jgi:adenylate cyclase